MDFTIPQGPKDKWAHIRSSNSSTDGLSADSSARLDSTFGQSHVDSARPAQRLFDVKWISRSNELRAHEDDAS